MFGFLLVPGSQVLLIIPIFLDLFFRLLLKLLSQNLSNLELQILEHAAQCIVDLCEVGEHEGEAAVIR